MLEGNFPFSRVCPSVPVVILMIKVIILLLPSIRLFKSADKTISRPYWRQVCVSVGGPVDILLRSDPSADLWPDVSSLHSLSPGQQRVFPCLFSTIPHELLMHMHTRTNPTRPAYTNFSITPSFPHMTASCINCFFRLFTRPGNVSSAPLRPYNRLCVYTRQTGPQLESSRSFKTKKKEICTWIYERDDSIRSGKKRREE